LKFNFLLAVFRGNHWSWPVKKKARLDASQNALRIVEQAIGGKLVEKGKKL
jgi:hypothetical protein